MHKSDRHPDFSASAGFTLVEMLVAVAMGAALVAAAATVFALASEAIGTSTANTQVSSQLRVLYSWLDRDFGRIRLDGPMVIVSDNEDYTTAGGGIENARLDRVLFSISGDIPALKTSDHVSLGMVLYGHDLPADSLSSPTHEDMFDLSLTRWARLMMSGATPPVNSEFYQAPMSFGNLLAYWYSTTTVPDFVAYFQTRPDTTGNEDFAEMIAHVVSFGVIRYEQADGTVVDWSDGAGGPPLSGTETTFGPADEKPLWIEFEIVLRDSNNRLEEPFTAIYRVNLPSR